MKKVVTVYKSKYGSTKKYAEWISERLQCDLFEASKINKATLQKYDIIIFGGGLYAGGINGISIITKNDESLNNKKRIVFTVGLANPENKEQYLPILNKSFTLEMQKNIQFFHFRGGIDYRKLNLIHKSMMAMLKTTVARKSENELSDEDKMLLETYGGTVDFTEKTAIAPLITYVNKLLEENK